jgi:hypothetical protein
VGKRVLFCGNVTEYSVWEEPTSPDTIMIGPDGHVTAGTLNKLVEFMTNDTKDCK